MEKARTVSKILLSLVMIGGGINHFCNLDFYLHLMPDYLPFPREIAWLSGVVEIGLGIALFFRSTMRLSGLLIITMLAIFLLVHVDMLMHAHDKFADIPLAALWLRLPLQAALMFWAWWSTREPIETDR